MDRKKIYIDGIDSKIKVFEESVSAGLTLSANDVEALDKDVNNLFTVSKLSDEEKQAFIDRINDLKSIAVSKEKYDAVALTRRAIPVYEGAIEKIRNRRKVAKGAAITLAIAGGAAVVTLGAIAAKGASKKQVEPVIVNTELEATVEEETETPIVYTEMDAEYKETADNIVTSMNDGISKGLEVTEENKEKLALQYVEYYMLNQMDVLTDEQWANIFQSSAVTATDIMNAKEYYEWIDEKRVTVSTDESTLLDYSSMFTGSDLTLLTDAEKMLLKVRTTSGQEKKTATSEFKKYILENLGDSTKRMNYSERAMDTFRAVYFDAFDELTNHAVIDDELEHAINTTITCSLSESELDVQDKTIKSLQSDFETYLQEKLEIRLQNGWTYAANNELNPYNDINEIAKYVAEHIDLSLYKELPDYEETLNSMFLKGGASKSKDDSGVSDGKGGVISKSDMLAHGVDPSDPNAKAKYEAAVIAETEAYSESTKQVTNADGVTVSGTNEDYDRGYQDGYYAGNNGMSASPSGSASYNLGYNDGYALGAADREAKLNSISTQEETTFIPVDGPTTYEESEITTYDYTGGTPNSVVDTPVQSETTFVPVDEAPVQTQSFDPAVGTEEIISETYTEEGYTTGMLSRKSSAISELQSLKNIYMSYFNSSKSVEDEHTKTV